MKTTKRLYTVKCVNPVTENQLMNIKSLLGVDNVEYTHPKLVIHYDLQFINREIVIKHLTQEKIQCSISILQKIFNMFQIFSEKNIIKNNKLLPFYG
ncbi:MAG: hypothetical protein N3F66_10590 [Spirochaetes bacterium]|nr:hypothetical protein [Spirochaetota bacterium]